MRNFSDKLLFGVIFSMLSIEAFAGSNGGAFQGINKNATIDNVAANSQTFLGNLFEFFVNLGLVAGIIVGLIAGLKMKKISAGEEQGSYFGPIVMLFVSGGLASVWFVVFMFSNTVEAVAS